MADATERVEQIERPTREVFAYPGRRAPHKSGFFRRTRSELTAARNTAENPAWPDRAVAA